MTDEYTLKHMKKKAGQYWGSGTLIVNPEGKILVAKRTDTLNYAGPGGKVDLGESVLQGAVREIKEECNLTVNPKNLKCYGVNVSAYDNKNAKDNNEKMWISFLFIATKYSGTVKNQEEEMEPFEWLTIDEIKKLPLFPPFKRAFDWAIEAKVIK